MFEDIIKNKKDIIKIFTCNYIPDTINQCPFYETDQEVCGGYVCKYLELDERICLL